MKISPRTYEAYDLMHKGILALGRAEMAGIRVDLEYLESKKKHLTRRIERLEGELKDTSFYRHWEHTTRRVNINSNAQLANFLYNVKKIEPVKTTTSGQGATDEEALKQLGIQELDILLQIRKLRKVRDTYLEAFEREQVDGYLHPFFNLHLVRTYRSSSDSPNFQNIPMRDEESMQICRQALYPRPGHQLLEVDYSGLEVRIAACYHKDPNMLRYINDPKSDMHGDMAKQIFLLDYFDKKDSQHYELRQAAKNGFVFPQFYGDYFGNCAISMACTWGKLPQNGKWSVGQGIELNGGHLADHLIKKGITSLSTFSKHLEKIEKDFWENRFPDYAAWKERWWSVYQKHGYISTLTGFQCSGIMGKNDCINYPVQGSAFHCNLWSFIEQDRLMQEEKWDTRLVGQIHDSIILDVNPDEADYIKEVIRRVSTKDLPKAWPWIITPLDVDMSICPIDGSWAEKSKI